MLYHMKEKILNLQTCAFPGLNVITKIHFAAATVILIKFVTAALAAITVLLPSNLMQKINSAKFSEEKKHLES